MVFDKTCCVYPTVHRLVKISAIMAFLLSILHSSENQSSNQQDKFALASKHFFFFMQQNSIHM